MRSARMTGAVVTVVASGLAGMAPGPAFGQNVQSPSAGSPRAVVEATADPTVVWAVGDLCDDDNAVLDCDDVGRLIANDPATDAVLSLGDLQYENASLAKFNTFYDPKMGAGKRLWAKTYPAPGNHEYLTPGAAGYFDYWKTRAGDRSRGYYGVTLGGWQVVAANSNCSKVGGCGATSPQGRFIASYLDRAGTCELVFDHHPAFSDGGQGDSADGRALFAVAYQNRGELFLSGHDHNYQRFAPRRPDGSISTSTGVRQFVVGTGGKDLRGYRTTRQRTQYRQNTRFGALRLVLSSTGYSARFMSISGSTMDTASGTCHS
ncbi:MAG: Alkaline phosphatase [uncultured Nocardioidaceae bacterium]|uniref:Alkaline phosphatase n=1 Tax=uncultured Nocardioidaceae bacterium TaxID=253824 RepID=A0A6J4N8T3_9ACTN|nr:MAG: Alkaline phosphatase [uncultured Nocardioidaceae bacterium]